MILPIYTYGQPVLRKVSEDIPEDFPELPELIDNMFDTLAASGGIGLAAPQIGRSVRIVVIDLDVISDDIPESSNMTIRIPRLWRKAASRSQEYTRR